MTPTEKVRKALDIADASDIEIITTDKTIFTVDDAANAIGVTPSEILKSLILIADKTEPFLVLMCGANKVDAKLAAKSIGHNRARMMPPEEVYSRYGYHVGGVPPVGYDENLRAVIDEDIFAHKIVWAAAGTDHAFFPVEPGRLLEITGGVMASVKKV
ncbi:MAG: YbaK/EbsC family protein [Synergistaceae bacterium]|nr:YbaK/EbsC family protein [Synergistaceae bacterium]